MIETWKAGKYSGEGSEALIAAHADENCLLEMGPTDGHELKHTDGYKTYVGHAGWKAWIEFIASLDVPDYSVDSIEVDKEDSTKVRVAVSYTPRCKFTNKTGRKMADIQDWTVKDGKVVGLKSGSAVDELDELYSMSAESKAVVRTGR